MSEQTREKLLAARVRCEDCGGEAKNVQWSPGTPCPRCGSLNFSPVPVVRRGSDYASTDRSQGFAIEDIRFGRLAQWVEFITPKQCQQALFEQKELARSGRTVPDLGSMFQRGKLMTRRQVKAVIGALSVGVGNREDAEFAELAMRHGQLSKERLAECLKLQRAAAQSGRDAPPLPLLLHEKRAMQENHIIALLKASGAHEKGLLHGIRTAAETKPESELSKAFGGRISQRMLLQGAMIAAFVLVAVVFLLLRFSGPGEYATVECASCHAVGGAPVDSEWPLKCPECGDTAVYPQAICAECGTRFPVKGLGYGTMCPKCKSSKYVLITSKIDLEKIMTEIRIKQAMKKNLP